MAILSFVYGTLDDVAMTTSVTSPDDSGIVSQVCSLVTVAVFLAYVHFDGHRYAALLNVAVGIVATGLIFLPFLGYSYNLLLMVLTHIGWELSLLVSYALAVEVARGERRRLLGVARWCSLPHVRSSSPDRPSSTSSPVRAPEMAAAQVRPPATSSSPTWSSSPACCST